MRRAFLFLFLIFTPLVADGASIFINEIAWMGTSVSTADEWIELNNDSNADLDISGWRLEWRGGEYGMTFGSGKCTNTIVRAGGYFLLERTNDDTVLSIAADCIYTGALSNNPGEYIVLRDSFGQIINSVDASSSGWPAGDNTTKDTMQKSGSSWITASPTPRAINFGVFSSSPPLPPSSLPPPTSSSQSLLALESADTPSIKVYAGEDRTVINGSLVEFSGSATGLKGEPLTSARFFWNFGDGETKEGRAVSHIFMIPGKYTVGLYISSGEYTASDYLIVDVTPNQITIASVLLGEDGYIKLANLTNFEVDIGGWVLEDSSGKRFNVPPRTKISIKTEIAFANVVTGLLKTNFVLPLILRYPNLSLATEWTGTPSFPDTEIVEAEFSPKISNIAGKESAPLAVTTKSMPVYTEVAADTKDEAVKAVAPREELAVSSGSARSSLFFIASAVFGLVAAVGFLFLRRIFTL